MDNLLVLFLSVSFSSVLKLTLVTASGLQLLIFVFLPRELVLDPGFRHDLRGGGLATAVPYTMSANILVDASLSLSFFTYFRGLGRGDTSSGLAVGGEVFLGVFETSTFLSDSFKVDDSCCWSFNDEAGVVLIDLLLFNF